MKIKKLLFGLFCIALIASTVGCANRSTSAIPKPKISMKSMTQVSANGRAEATCDLPEGWELLPINDFAIYGADKSYSVEKMKKKVERLPYMLLIDNYEQEGVAGAKQPDEFLQIYKELFAGK